MEILSASLERHVKAIRVLFPKPEVTSVLDVRGLKSYESIERFGACPGLIVGAPGEFQPEDSERLIGFCKKHKLRSMFVIREFKDNATKDNTFIQFFSIPGLIAKECAIIHEVCESFPFLYIKCIVGDIDSGGIRSDFEIKCKLLGFTPIKEGKEVCPEVVITAAHSLPVPTLSELKCVCLQLNELKDCSGENYFLGSLSDISEINQDSPDLFSDNTFGYNDTLGFCECNEELRAGLIVECDARRLDRTYAMEWSRAYHSKFYSSSRLNSRQVRLIVIKCPIRGEQTIAGAFCMLSRDVSRKMIERASEINDFNIFKTPGRPLVEKYVQLLRRNIQLDVDSNPQPPRVLLRAFKFIVKWESDYFEYAGKFIDAIIQLHCLVAASIVRFHLDPAVGGVIANMFEKRPHTELGNWMDELRMSKKAFETHLQVFLAGRGEHIATKIPAALLPCVERLYDTAVFELLEEFQQLRNRKFAHAGTLSKSDKDELMSEADGKIHRYLRLTEPFWSCFDFASVSQVAASTSIRETGCTVSYDFICHDEQISKSAYIPGDDGSLFEKGSLVVVHIDGTLGPVPLLPLYYLQNRMVPDSEHIFFLSNKTKDGKHIEFNSYTGAPKGTISIATDDPMISGFIEKIEEIRRKKVTAELVIVFDGVRLLPCLVQGSNYLVIVGSDYPAIYSFFAKNDTPLRFSRERFSPIPDVATAEAAPPESWLDPNSQIGLLFKTFFQSGRDYRFFAGSARAHSSRCTLYLE
jgi:hypothetical protein